MSRSIWKGPYICSSLFRDSLKNKSTIKIWDRGSVVPFMLIQRTVLVHTGKEFRRVHISRDKIGYKFGEFCYTRKPNRKEEKLTKKPVKRS